MNKKIVEVKMALSKLYKSSSEYQNLCEKFKFILILWTVRKSSKRFPMKNSYDVDAEFLHILQILQRQIFYK